MLLEDGDFATEIEALRIPTSSLRGGRLRNPLHVARTTAALSGLLRRERPDLVVNWLSTAHLYSGPAAAAAGLAERCVWWQHDLHGARAPEGARRRDRLGAYRGRLLDRLATMIPAAAVGCVSEAVRAEQLSRRPRRRTFVVLNGIEDPQRAPEAEVAALRREIGIPAGSVVVGLVGRMFAWKGHHLLLQALAQVHQSGMEVYGLFVGGGGHRPNSGYEAYVTQLVAELGLRERVHFTGQVADAIPFVQAMDMLVNASYAEPFGLVLLEAMALGVPVIAINEAGPAEIVVDGRSGLLVPRGSPGDLAAAIRLLSGDPARRRELGAAGRQRYLERFTAERMTRDVEARLEELAA